jgi:hypothetical protein
MGLQVCVWFGETLAADTLLLAASGSVSCCNMAVVLALQTVQMMVLRWLATPWQLSTCCWLRLAW